jgi:hypothetical protein
LALTVFNTIFRVRLTRTTQKPEPLPKLKSDQIHKRYRPIRGPLFCLFSNSGNTNAFLIPRTWCSMPIAIAPPILMKIYCNFVRVLHNTDWPICTPNIGQNKYLWFLGPWGQAVVETSKFRFGPRKKRIGHYSVSVIIWVLLEGCGHG